LNLHTSGQAVLKNPKKGDRIWPDALDLLQAFVWLLENVDDGSKFVKKSFCYGLCVNTGGASRSKVVQAIRNQEDLLDLSEENGLAIVVYARLDLYTFR
jgi:hypothetical protein